MSDHPQLKSEQMSMWLVLASWNLAGFSASLAVSTSSAAKLQSLNAKLSNCATCSGDYEKLFILSYEMQRTVVLWKSTDVAEEHDDSIFMAEK
jgi:hypothetical protein